MFPWPMWLRRDNTPVPNQGLEQILAAVESLRSADGAVADATTAVMEDVRAALEHLQIRMKAIEDDEDKRDDWQKRITIAVGEGIERVERTERRIQGTVKRARKELADAGFEHGGLEVEGTDIQLVDAHIRDQERLQPVPGNVEVEPEASSIKGVSREALARVRGI